MWINLILLTIYTFNGRTSFHEKKKSSRHENNSKLHFILARRKQTETT